MDLRRNMMLDKEKLSDNHLTIKLLHNLVTMMAMIVRRDGKNWEISYVLLR